MSATIALITSSEMCDVDRDMDALIAELQRLHISAAAVAWETPGVNWADFSLVLIRSPWNYHERLTEFLAWAKQVDQVTKLMNPLPLIRWNSHKSYLLELQRDGIPMIPTQFIERGSRFSVEQLPEGELIAKPAIGIGSSGIIKGQKSDEHVLERLHALTQQGDVLVQPFSPNIQTEGETSLIFFGGEYSHAVRKIPTSGDFRVQAQHGGTAEQVEPTSAQRLLAEKTIAQLQYPVAHARVDMIHWDEHPVLMELEAIEPDLFLRESATAIKRYAATIKKLIP
ncbi:ATP-grasp domain-containing protein [Planctomicrobium sp. SH527]|uniref:ATP-grasp domain-containing protein n=1 Tax=Planctomicrobium sp. SH527 TaxID=3448123 RepID=UPI003F5BC414